MVHAWEDVVSTQTSTTLAWWGSIQFTSTGPLEGSTVELLHIDITMAMATTTRAYCRGYGGCTALALAATRKTNGVCRQAASVLLSPVSQAECCLLPVDVPLLS